MKMNVKKVKNLFLTGIVLVTVLCGCSSANNKVTKVLPAEEKGETTSMEVVLKPGDEGFSFDYRLPENWEPANFQKDNSEVISQQLMEYDLARFPEEDDTNAYREISEYYIQTKSAHINSYFPLEDFWNRNPDMPKELYELPVNVYSDENSLRTIGGAEFSELNGDLIPYYVEAARHIFSCFYNLSKDSIGETLQNGLYYSYPKGTVEETSVYKETSFYQNNLPNWIKSEGAFLTDESLCYLGSDGTIRVRGMILFKEEYEGGEVIYGKVFSDLILGIISEAAKLQPWSWSFGDFYYVYHADPIRPELISGQEYDSLIEQHNLTTGTYDRPQWAGLYGGR